MSRSPLLGQLRKVNAPEGCSLSVMADVAEPDAFARRYLVAFVDGVEVPVEAWEVTKPKAGAIVNFALRAGGKNVIRTILSIAVIAVATFVSGGAWTPAALEWAAPFLAAGVAIAGNLLINALVPLETPGQNTQRPDPAYTVTGARNQARLLQPVPMVLGRMRMYPPLWGQPIQETIGGDVWLRLPFCFGPAPLRISEPKIGDTPLSSYTDVQLELRQKESDPPHLLYAGDPDQDAVGAALTTSFQSRNTAADVDEIEVVFGFRQGLGRFDDKGRKQSKSVTFVVEYRVAGSGGAWQNVRPNGVQASAAANTVGEPDRSKVLFTGSLMAWAIAASALPSVPTGPFAVTRSEPGKQFQYRISFAVPRAAAGYEVQVRRTTADTTDSNATDQAHWEILGSRKSWVDPFPERKLASGVLRVKATNQLNNIIDTFNAIVEPEVPVFSSAALADPSGASPASLEAPDVSRNCSHLILNVYRGPQTPNPRADSKIDWPSFAEFAAFCEANNLTFSEEVQTPMTRAELARRIAQAGYGRLHKWGGKLAVAIDRDRTGEVPSQVFTPRNIANLRWRKSFPPEVHAVTISFANEDNGYQADEVTLYLDGYDASNATKFETLQVPGKTNVDEVRIVGRQYINNSLRMTEQFSFDMDAEHLSVKPGGFGVLQHDVIGTGLGAQRVETVLTAGGNVTGFILDHPIKTPAGPTLGCRWRFMDDDGVEAWFEASDEVAVTRDAEDPKRFMFVTPRAAAVAPKKNEMVLVGETETVALDVLVRDIAPEPGRRAGIVAIPLAAERFAPDGTPLPPHDPKVTLPIGARPPTPVLLSKKAFAREIAVSFHIPAMPRGVTLTGIEAAVRETGSDDDSWTPLPALGVDDRIVSAPAGDVGAKYDIRIVAVGRDSGGQTVYSDPLLVAAVDADAVPVQPVGCGASFVTRTSANGAQQLVLQAGWTPNEDPDILDTAVEMLTATGPDVWTEIGRGRAAAGRIEINGLPVGKSYNLAFVNVSRRGAPSLRTTIATITAPDTLVATSAMDAFPGSQLDVNLTEVLAAADAAAASAAAASADATEAATQAGLASASASSASTQAGNAFTYAGQASIAKDDAEDAKDAAVAAAVTAGTHASNASGSASSASGSASAASGYASTASGAATLAANYYLNRLGNAGGDRPAVGEDFSNGSTTTPAATAALAAGTVVNVANEGDVRQFTSNVVVEQRGWLPVLASHTYRLRSRNRVTVNGTSNALVMAFTAYSSNGTALGTVGLTSVDSAFTVADGWRTDTITTTASAILAAFPTAAFIRGRVQGARNSGNTYSGATWQCAASLLEDITDIAETNAVVSANASAQSSINAAQAGTNSSVSASLGTLSANVSTNTGAITTINGAAAFWETIVAAGGGDLAAVRLKAGASGAYLELISTVLRLANVSNGAIIEVMRAVGGEAFFSRPVSVDGGGKRLTIGPGYGVSGSQVILWFGPDTVAPSLQSRTNGYFSFGTDNKIYVGVTELNNAAGVSPQSSTWGGEEIIVTSYVTLATITMPGTLASGNKIRFQAMVSAGTAASGTSNVNWRIRDTTGGGSTVIASGTASFNTTGPTNISSLAGLGSQLFTAAGAGPRTYDIQFAKTGSVNTLATDGSFLCEKVG